MGFAVAAPVADFTCCQFESHSHHSFLLVAGLSTSPASLAVLSAFLVLFLGCFSDYRKIYRVALFRYPLLLLLGCL